MSARILVVDDVPANVKLLEARLSAEYFDVLIARVRSLTRLKMMTDELRMRAITSLEIGVEAPERSAVADAGKGGRILLVDDRPSSYEKLAPVLSAEHSVDVETNPAEALF